MEDDVRLDAEGTVERREHRVLQELTIAQKAGDADEVDRHQKHDEQDGLTPAQDRREELLPLQREAEEQCEDDEKHDD